MLKIKEIAVTELTTDHDHEVRQNIYALCVDGTLWRHCTIDGVCTGWEHIEGPPGDEPGGE